MSSAIRNNHISYSILNGKHVSKSKSNSKNKSKENSRNASPSRSTNGLFKNVVTYEMTSDDNKYLATVVGEPLKMCLQELAEKVPADPMEWIAQWLYSYANAQLYFQEKATFLTELDEARTLLEAEKKKRARDIGEMRANKRIYVKNFNMMRPRGGSSFSGDPSQSDLTGVSGKTGKSRGGDPGGDKSNRRFAPRSDGSQTQSDYSGSTDEFSGDDGQSYGDERGPRKEGKPRRESRRESNRRDSRGQGKSHHRVQQDVDGREYYRDDDGNKRYSIAGHSDEYDNHDPRDPRSVPSNRATGAKLDKNHATWGVNCRLALVCQHPVLGDMEPRPPLMYPETPEWWERKGYLPESLYDHEVYSRRHDNDIPDPRWAGMDSMNYKDLLESGPWLASGYVMNAQESFKDMVCIPAQPELAATKRNRKQKEGDYFPRETKNQKMLLEQEEEKKRLKEIEEASRKKKMFKKE